MEELIELDVHLPVLKHPLVVSVSPSSSFKTIVDGLCQQHKLPPYYTIPLLSALTSAFNQTYLTTPNSYPTNDAASETQTRQQFINAYQENTLLYYNKHEEDEFPRAFNTLIKCPVILIFDALLELDQNYTLIMHDLASDHHHSLMAMQSRQAQEMENLQPQNRNHLFAQHVEEMEVKQATFASDMLQTQQSQRQEYRDFVMELYREYQLRINLSLENSKSNVDITQHTHISTSTSQSSSSLSISPSTSSTSSTLSTSSGMGSAKSIDGKELVATAANRIWKKDIGAPSCSSSSNSIPSSPSSTTKLPQQQQQKRQRQDSTTSRISQQSTSNDSWKRSSVGGVDDLAMQKMIQDIRDMGFPTERAEAAVTLTNGQNLERAISLLVECSDQIDQQVKRRSSPTFMTTSPPPPSSSISSSSLHQRQDSWNDSIPSFRRHSLQKSTPPTSSSTALQQHKPLPISALSSASSPNNNGGKSWNPISFLQQQKQALENTNLSTVRKLGGWLGKAMENLGIEHDENDPQFATHENGPSPKLVESFTIGLGTAQIKSNVNLRLMVADAGMDILDPLPFDQQRELGYKAQTAMRLYTSQLSAVLVLVEKSELIHRDTEGGQQTVDWQLYKVGKGSNRALHERTLRSTEFHFPTTESQLDVIETNVQQQHRDYLQEGAFFITKHSNLPMHQIVFHLIIDSEDILVKELSGRHPLMVGLRNILRLTTRYDISSLTLPLIMLPDRFLDQPEHYMPATVDQPQQHSTWLSKRSEAVMKTVKGYLMEASRGKQSHSETNHRADTNAFGGSGLCNVEFFIPLQQNVYVADPLTATTPTSASAPSSIMHPHHHAGPYSSPFPPTHSSSSSSLSSMPASTTATTINNNANSNNNLTNTNALLTQSTTSSNDGISTATPGMTINSAVSNSNNMYSASSSSLPSTPTASHHSQYARIPTPHVEHVFQQLRTSLANIFRTS